MEELLNKLIKKGWKPFGDENVKEIRIYSEMDMECIYGKRKSDFYYFSPRQIVSKESGLWQFVCENKLQPTNRSGSWEYSDGYTGWTCMAYQFRLIESSLIDESELEEFLLNSIKLD